MRPEKLTTCHHSCWALVKRGGKAEASRPFTRMAFLVGTIAPNGIAEAVTGYIMGTDMVRWTKTVRRIEWADIVKQWPKQPTRQQIIREKKRMSK